MNETDIQHRIYILNQKLQEAQSQIEKLQREIIRLQEIGHLRNEILFRIIEESEQKFHQKSLIKTIKTFFRI
jgi:hypothetical protein